MSNTKQIFTLFLLLAFCTLSKAQNRSNTASGPKNITRSIIQDKKGNIWLASSEGIFKYDGQTFTNITGKENSARFSSVLEDSKGNLWFGSLGSGVYNYDGRTFKNFTTKQGLPSDGVMSIYEDKAGNIWIGRQGGLSRYDGATFRNFTVKDGLPNNAINTIIEDKTGKLWLGTMGAAVVYDGKTFTVLSRKSQPFIKVRSIIQDKNRNIWLGGDDGLWSYDGKTFTQLSDYIVSHVYEDRKGNIWTSAEKKSNNSAPVVVMDSMPSGFNNANNKKFALSRYDEKALLSEKPTLTEIRSEYPENIALFGILEAKDGSIWFGAENGVYRYDGKEVKKF
ncbi:two-component regulator propeller domain-containing protein [Mucilaginibacter calamicampi]|uniref:Two-component regulator propeller domain-containing protein n=1 Tax=Mucilaginibacter calamicampi TaxID=1302352 RepID=A0ABW2YTR8_9SPHI